MSEASIAMNICIAGYGMMGTWHAQALQSTDCVLHTLVGRRPEPSAEFARRFGFLHWTTDLHEALSDPAIDAVILATPSEQHANGALAALAAGKHTLVEIPLAMNLTDAERVVAAAAEANLTLGVVHPLRMQPDMAALHERVLTGEERIRHINGRFFMHRVENVGATGYRRSWTDNLLWHHLAHLCDFGLWFLNGEIASVSGRLSAPDPRTGTPIDAWFSVETAQGQTLVCAGSYDSRATVNDVLLITDADAYRWEPLNARIATASKSWTVEDEVVDNARITLDFVAAVAEGRPAAVPGQSVLRALAVLQEVQNDWDRTFGQRSIPGRP
jgi:2-hydroxy-4-carboxymuconate semialdehyde hemiacetal dehydrogenase